MVALMTLVLLAGTDEPSLPEPSFALGITGSVAIDKPAAGVAVSGRYRVQGDWLVGVDAEWNPWASFEVKRVRPGVLNAYVTLVRRYPVTETVAVRSTANAGVSVLLFPVVGAPAGTTGFVVGISLLGLDVELRDGLRFVIDPAHIMVPVPQLTGWPVAYQQYRLSLGLQLDL